MPARNQLTPRAINGGLVYATLKRNIIRVRVATSMLMRRRIDLALKRHFTPIDAAKTTRRRLRICERDTQTTAGLKHFVAVTNGVRRTKNRRSGKERTKGQSSRSLMSVSSEAVSSER